MEYSRARTAASVLALAFALAAPAFAQSNAPATAGVAAQDPDDTAPAEIVVTAQKRTERLQDVPVAVSVLTGDTITRQGGINIETAQYLVPSLNFRKSGTSLNQSLFLRGVGTINFSIAAEPSVATVLDGVVLARAGEAFSDLIDLERIEVLRGPQGTLFGKNASAGVVNVVSKRPTDNFEGFGEIGYFSGADYRVRAGVNIPFSPTIRGRFNGFYSEFEGNYRNVAPTVNGQPNPNGRFVNGYQRYGVRGIIEADATENLKLTFIGDWRKANDDCCAESIGTSPAGIAAGALPAGSFLGKESRTISQNLITATREENWGVSLQADLDVGAAGTITSITAYRRWDNREIRDGDFLSQAYVDQLQVAQVPPVPGRLNLNQLHDDGPQKSNTFSQELRLASPGDQTLEYVVGAFYSRAKSDRVFTRSDIVCDANPRPATLVPCGSAGAPASTFPTGTATFGSVFENVAVFGQGTFNVTDSLRLIAGLRYTHDELHVYHSRVTPLAGPGINGNFDAGVFNNGATTVNAAGQTVFVPGPSNGVPFRARTTADNLSGRAGVQFDLTRDNTVYATYSRGYKGPAYNIFFNLTATGTPVIDPETADSYEVGLKNTLFGGAVVVNLAGFYAKYYNYQANNPDFVAGVLTTRLTNAGTISTRGFEADFLARPSRMTSISGGVAYAEARVDQFRAPPGAAPTAITPPGTPLANAPRFKASLAFDQRYNLSESLDLNVGVNGSYQTEQLSQFSENAGVRTSATIGDYALVDVQAGIGDRDGRWRLTGYVRNLFNQSFAASITTGGPGGGLRYIIPREAERFFGATLRVNLGN